jgi:hypothetical protein
MALAQRRMRLLRWPIQEKLLAAARKGRAAVGGAEGGALGAVVLQLLAAAVGVACSKAQLFILAFFWCIFCSHFFAALSL